MAFVLSGLSTRLLDRCGRSCVEERRRSVQGEGLRTRRGCRMAAAEPAVESGEVVSPKSQGKGRESWERRKGQEKQRLLWEGGKGFR